MSPNMPKRLAARAAQLLKQSPTKQKLTAKIGRGDANRAKHNEAVRAKASKTIAKMQAARARKLLNEMDAGIVLLNTAEQRKLSPVKLPKRLSERVERLTMRFGYDGAEREIAAVDGLSRCNSFPIDPGRRVVRVPQKPRRRAVRLGGRHLLERRECVTPRRLGKRRVHHGIATLAQRLELRRGLVIFSPHER